MSALAELVDDIDDLRNELMASRDQMGDQLT